MLHFAYFLQLVACQALTESALERGNMLRSVQRGIKPEHLYMADTYAYIFHYDARLASDYFDAYSIGTVRRQHDDGSTTYRLVRF